MLSDFISITNLQRHLKKVFHSKQPIHVVLSKNAVNGLVFSKEAAEMLIDSGILQQLREEWWEWHDKETVRVVRGSRKGQGEHSLSFDEWAKIR